MITHIISTYFPSSPVQVPLRKKVAIYGGIWLVAALILATRSELYLDDDSETGSRWLVFAFAPMIAAFGLDFAALSAFHWSTSQVGVLTWLFAVGFVAHAFFVFSCVRRSSFYGLIFVFVVALSIGVGYALRFYHLDFTMGHG